MTPGPIDNDTAADWFGDEMDKMKISKRIREGLESTSSAEVRAAAFLLQQVGFVYVYPIDDLDADLKAAIDALRGVRARSEAELGPLVDPDWRADITAQIGVLEARLEDPSAPGSTSLFEAIAKLQSNPDKRKRALLR